MIGSRASAALVLMASTMVAAAPPSIALDDPRPVGRTSTTDQDSQRVVVSFRGRVGQSSRGTRSRDLLESLPAASYDVVHRYDNVAAIALEVDDAALAELEARDDVTVAYDSRVTAFDTESTTLMRADDAQAAGRTGDGVTVAVLDTGAYSSRGVLHPGLVDDVVEQRCFAGPDCLTRSEARDLGGHGTHVAGILTGPDGIAPDVDLRVYKVLDDDGNGWNSDIAAALDHVASLPPGSVDLVNMSLGGGVYGSTAACDADKANRVTNDAIAAVVRAGITVLAATGNAGSTTGVAHPACAPGVIGVGAVEDRGVRRDGECRDLRPDRVSCYSNGTPVSGRGELVDVVAPGCRITSLGTANDYDAVMCGTSMATPMATGVAALVLQEEDLTPAELEQRLEDTGVPVVDDRFRRPVTVPRVDAVAATGTPISDLTAPTEAAVSLPDAGSADLTWEPVAGAAGYRVYRSAARVRSRELVATTTEPGWSDETVPCGPVTYTLRTVDSDGTLSPGATLTAEARACPARPGTAPRLDPVDASTTRVSWPQQAGPVELEYRVSGGTPYTSVGVFDPGTGSVDHAVDGCGTAIYRLVAVAGDDRSIPSPVAWRSICGPANDSRSAATTLPVPTADRPTAVTVDVARADWSSEDPVFDCVSEHQVGNNGVWYRLDPRRDVMVTMNTAGTTARRAGGRAAPMLAVYDVAPDGAGQRDCSATTLDPFTNQVRYARTSLQLRRGHSYYVHLAHRYDLRADRPQEARLTLRWRADLRRVRGDDRSAPRVLTRDGQDVVAGAQNATVDDTDPVHRCMFGPTRSAGSHTLWWSLEPQRTGTAGLSSFDNTGAFTDTVISLFAVDPDAPDGLRPVACSDDFDGSPAPFLRYRVTRGQQYLVMLSRASGVPTATESRVRLHYRLERMG